MTKLTPQQLADRDSLSVRLVDAYAQVEEAVDAYNTALQTAFAAVLAAQEAYNAVLDDIKGWQADIAVDMQTYIDDRSEKWQESDRGERYLAWQAEYEAEMFETLELEAPEELLLETGDQAERFDELTDDFNA